MPEGKYVWLWEKYRPVILKLMSTCTYDSPQEYKLSKHEFVDSNNKRPTGYAFSLRVFQSKSENDIKKSLTAQNLLSVLKNSSRAEELMNDDLFEFKMDKTFVLEVSREKRIAETPEV